MSRRTPRIAVATVFMMLLGPAAFATFTALQSANQTFTTGSMPAGVAPTVTVDGRDVVVTWTQQSVTTVAGPTAITSYRLNRGVNATTCTPSLALSTYTCRDIGLAPNTYNYTLAAIYNSWTGTTSSNSRNAVVAAPSVSLSPTTVDNSGGATSQSTASLASFLDNELVSFKLDANNGTQIGTATVGATGGIGSGSITIPAATTAGSHTIFAVGGNGSQASTTITVTSAATLRITSVVPDSGNRKYHFRGTGASGASVVTVTICDENVFPCTGNHIQATSSTSASPSASWTSAQDNNNLEKNGTGAQYFAQATQGAATSPVFLFASTNLEPDVFDVQMANGAIGSKADSGDTLTVTLSEPIDAATLCSTWTNAGLQTSSASAKIANSGSNDVLGTVTVAGCSFNFGSVALGADYVSADVTFGASSVSWDPTTDKLTIALGGGTGQNTVSANSAASYTPSANIKDQNGVAIAAVPVGGRTTSRF